MGFIDHELNKVPQLAMNRYMTTFMETVDGLIHIVLMEWERGLDKYKLFLLMHMSHFGRTTKFNACVKQLLVCFHGACL